MSRSPLYERGESVVAGDIADGSLRPETQLPPEDRHQGARPELGEAVDPAWSQQLAWSELEAARELEFSCETNPSRRRRR
jgi:hypothetical protein